MSFTYDEYISTAPYFSPRYSKDQYELWKASTFMEGWERSKFQQLMHTNNMYDQPGSWMRITSKNRLVDYYPLPQLILSFTKYPVIVRFDGKNETNPCGWRCVLNTKFIRNGNFVPVFTQIGCLVLLAEGGSIHELYRDWLDQCYGQPGLSWDTVMNTLDEMFLPHFDMSMLSSKERLVTV